MSVTNASTAVPSAVVNLSYLPYLNLGWAVSCLACQFTIIATVSFLLHGAWSKRSRVKASSLSNSLIVYLVYHITFCVLCFPYHGPVFMKFIPATSQIVIHPQLSYYISIPVGLHYYISPLPVFFLTVDRCLVLRFPFHYTKRVQKYFFFVNIYTILCIGSVSFAAFLLTPISDQDKARCSLIGCFLMQYRSPIQINSKLIVGIINVICTGYFLRTLRLGNNKSLKNRVVKITLLMEIIFNVGVTIITAMFLQLTGVLPQIYLGQFFAVLTTLDAGICCLYYVQALLKRNRNIETVPKQNTEIHLRTVSTIITRSH